MLFHIKLSDTFFEFYVVSYNEEEVLHVLCQMPRAQLCVHVCALLSHKEVPLICVSADLLGVQVTQQPEQEVGRCPKKGQ